MGLTRLRRHRQELGTVTAADPDTSLGQLTCTLWGGCLLCRRVWECWDKWHKCANTPCLPPHTHTETHPAPPHPPPPPTPTPSVNKNNSEINKRVLTGKLQLSRVDEVLVCLNTSVLPTLGADPLWSQLPLACLPSCSLEGAEEEEEATWECAVPFKQRPYQPRAAWGRNVGVMRNSACCHQSEAESTQNRQLFCNLWLLLTGSLWRWELDRAARTVWKMRIGLTKRLRRGKKEKCPGHPQSSATDLLSMTVVAVCWP